MISFQVLQLALIVILKILKMIFSPMLDLTFLIHVHWVQQGTILSFIH